MVRAGQVRSVAVMGRSAFESFECCWVFGDFATSTVVVVVVEGSMISLSTAGWRREEGGLARELSPPGCWLRMDPRKGLSVRCIGRKLYSDRWYKACTDGMDCMR